MLWLPGAQHAGEASVNLASVIMDVTTDTITDTNDTNVAGPTAVEDQHQQPSDADLAEPKAQAAEAGSATAGASLNEDRASLDEGDLVDKQTKISGSSSEQDDENDVNSRVHGQDTGTGLKNGEEVERDEQEGEGEVTIISFFLLNVVIDL